MSILTDNPSLAYEALGQAALVVAGLAAVLWFFLRDYPAVEHGHRISQLPGICSGDLALFDDPLPPWRTPHLRLRQWAWRFWHSLRGYKVYVVLNAPKPLFPYWPARRGVDAAIRVCLERSIDCYKCGKCPSYKRAWLRRKISTLFRLT